MDFLQIHANFIWNYFDWFLTRCNSIRFVCPFQLSRSVKSKRVKFRFDFSKLSRNLLIVNENDMVFGQQKKNINRYIVKISGIKEIEMFYSLFIRKRSLQMRMNK